MEAKDIIANQYGLSLRTIERDLGQDVAPNVVTSKPTCKERIYKDTSTWNPFVGCKFDCVYCKPSFQNNHYFMMQHKDCGLFNPHAHEERLTLKKISSDRIVFVCGDSDIYFANPDYMRYVFEVMRQDKKKGRVWFLQSKCPEVFEHFLMNIPENTILLTTLETNRDEGYDKISHAPPPSLRVKMFRNLNYPKKIVVIEPIMDFDLDIFVDWILSIKPLAVFIGYNSHPKAVKLPEPGMEKTLDLIVALKNKGIRVLTKELRKMAYRDLFPAKN